MPRPPRVEYEDAIYHVTTRGIEGRAIVLDDRDRIRWMEQFERVVTRYRWKVFAFALMDNHFHLFVQTPHANLSQGMHDLNGGYVSFFNTRHQRLGHLYQSRFRAYLVEDEGYWLEVSRYVHLNPVRAGLVKKPEDWQWSSYAGYHHPRERLDWVDYTQVLDEFGGDGAKGRRLYREFIEDGLGRELDSPFERAIHGLFLGTEAFAERIERLIDRLVHGGAPAPAPNAGRYPLATVVKAVSEHYGVDSTLWMPGRRYTHPARRVTAYLARQLTSATLPEIAVALGYTNEHSITVTAARVARAEASSQVRRDVRTVLAKLRKMA